ncbi:MAG: hypothetical protein WB760_02740, partial [Xanthobacteraceae bacterium]
SKPPRHTGAARAKRRAHAYRRSTTALAAATERHRSTPARASWEAIIRGLTEGENPPSKESYFAEGNAHIRPQLFASGIFNNQKSHPERDSLQKENSGRDRSDVVARPPIFRRLTLFFGSVLGGFLLFLYGGQKLYEKRSFFRASLCVCGLLLILGGTLLWLATDFFPWTWGWWL